MAQGLSVSDVVSIGIILSPTAAPGRNFGTLLILGSSPVIDVQERIRTYATLTQVATDFGVTAPEYQAAATYFGQSPQPYLLKIGRFAQTPTSGVLHGAILSAATQASTLAALQVLSTGNLLLTLNGTATPLTGLNFGAAANLNGIAGVITTALAANGTCTWDGQRFNILSNGTGSTSTVAYATSSGTVDIATLMGLSLLAGGPVPVAGVAAETPVAAVAAFSALTSDWYACIFATQTLLSDTLLLQVAATVEGLAPSRVLGITTQNTNALDPLSTTDIGSLLKLSGYSHTLVQYSSTNPYAMASFFGRALTVNYTGSKTVLTTKFKQEPGIIAETISETQAATLKAKAINVFVNYQNGAAIIQEGTVANGRFWDEVHGLDWLANTVQNDQFNILYQSLTKIPQTDDGVHILVTQFEATLAGAVENGLIAPGIWNAEGFGQLKRGDILPKGFYVFAPLISSQSQAERETRKSPLLQAAIKFSGAIHQVSCQISINR